MKPKKKTRSEKKLGKKAYLPAKSYLIANLIFLLGLLMFFLYFGMFRAGNHPIQAWLTELTGVVPPSKGLSAAFSEIVRFNLNEALLYNAHSIRVFSFFGIQLLLRIFFIVLAMAIPYRIEIKLMLLDILISLGLFIYSFYPLISFTLKISTELLN